MSRFNLQLLLSFFFFGLPLVGLSNCSLNDGHGFGGPMSCVVDNSITQGYAMFYYNILFLSAYFICIPLVLYIAISIAGIRWIVRFVYRSSDKTKRSPSEHTYEEGSKNG